MGTAKRVRSGRVLGQVHLASGRCWLAFLQAEDWTSASDLTFNYAMDENGRDITYPGMDPIATAVLKGNVIVYIMLHLSSKLYIIRIGWTTS